ncbi:MAG: hypothetical protein JSS07_01930 [Proteobacteria bacterium]|nr:hypothetical protein [Pseudomonadota bacterium]
MMKKQLLSILILINITNVYAFRDMKPMTDSEIRASILSGSIKSFEGECPCPFSRDKKGKVCGEDSEYYRTRGKILCYERDITDGEVNTYRQKYSITDPKGDPHGRLDFGINTEENNTKNPLTSPEMGGSSPGTDSQ